MDFTIGIGDTLPVLYATLTPAPGQTFTLAGSTVRFNAWGRADRALKIDQPATIEDASARRVSYTFSPTDTASKSKLEAVFVVTFPDGSVQSFPNAKESRIKVTVSG